VPLKFYRGISVDAEKGEDIKAKIRRQGLEGTEGQWRAEYFDLKPYLNELFERDDLSLDLTHPNELKRRYEIVLGGTRVPKSVGVYACGEKNGASFYAERDKTPNAISLEAVS